MPPSPVVDAATDLTDTVASSTASAATSKQGLGSAELGINKRKVEKLTKEADREKQRLRMRICERGKMVIQLSGLGKRNIRRTIGHCYAYRKTIQRNRLRLLTEAPR